MSFLEHLDELRKRLVKSVLILIAAFLICFNFSNDIYNFLSIPIRKALNEVQRRQLPVSGITGSESLRPINEIKEGDTGRYTISVDTSVGATVLPAELQSVPRLREMLKERSDCLLPNRSLANNAIVPKGVRLPLEYIDDIAKSQPNTDSHDNQATASESFTLWGRFHFMQR
ncbi:MAG: twin-arginine translocase subunit TatC [Acidobacteria bacterium]|nr:twin-arginine translocase subunit TatC [Acidobacteriota bacterium]